jgi:flavin reductase (DIM6/NTAB) family NADH-FMN oxidoreductase RutF
MPVYSLASYGGEEFNMNICTYVTAISRTPKMYAVAIEQWSVTLDLLRKEDVAVLQILTQEQLKLTKILGKRSAHSFNKQEYLNSHDLLTTWKDRPVLKNCAAYLLLKKVEEMKAGDHFLFLFELEQYTTRSENNILMFQDLIRENVIL